jgi:hypothetical protein
MRVTGGDARGRSRALDVRPRQSALPRQRAMLLATLSEQRGKADGPPCQRHNRACDRPRRITVTARPVRGRNAEDYCWRTRPTSAPVSLGGRAQIDPLPSWNVPRAWVYAALMSIEFESIAMEAVWWAVHLPTADAHGLYSQLGFLLADETVMQRPRPPLS